MEALGLMVLEKKIFKVLAFGCHGNQSSALISILLAILKEDQPRINSVKFG